MKTYTSIDPQHISQQQMHQHLLATVTPRPICLASTIDELGMVNLSPFSFFNVFSSNPPILIFSPARRGKDNTIKHTLENVMETQEVVINLVSYSMVNQVALSSADFPKGEDEFIKAGFTPLESHRIRPPRVAEAPVSFECVVDRILPLGDQPGAGNLVLAKVVLMHIDATFINEKKRVEGEHLDLVARMGDHWYTRITDKTLFKLNKSLGRVGIGVVNLPIAAQKSNILTGNDLGILGSIEQLPSRNECSLVKELGAVKALLASPDAAKIEAFHRLAQKYLRNGDPQTALSILILSEE